MKLPLDCYSYRLIGKLTTSLHPQEFTLHNMTVDCSTSSDRCRFIINKQSYRCSRTT